MSRVLVFYIPDDVADDMVRRWAESALQSPFGALEPRFEVHPDAVVVAADTARDAVTVIDRAYLDAARDDRRATAGDVMNALNEALA